MIGPLIMRGGEFILRCIPDMSADDKASIRMAAFGVATIVDPAGTAISTGIKVARELAKGD